MKKAIAWFADNSVAANLLMFVIVMGGATTLFQLTQEIFPETSSERVTVSVLYPGATPEEVEEGVCIRIEEQVQGVEGIRRLSSSAAEGSGTVTIEAEPDWDVRRLLDDIKTRVDAIDTFPEEAERPLIQELTLRRQVINIAVSGKADEETLKSIGERIRDEIAALDGITQVELANARPYEISIEVSEEALRRLQLTFSQVAEAVRRSSLDLPAGSVKTSGGEILLRSKGQAYRGPEFENIVLVTRNDGTHITLGEVATVVDGFADTDQSARFDGESTVLVQVFRVGDESVLEIAQAVKEYVSDARTRLPEGIHLTTWQDDTKTLRSRIDLMLRNGRAGLALVVLILSLFLRLRLSLWVSLGIPISFLGAIWLMPGFDVTVNLMSLFAFLLVLGILVDDAIVVGESIFSEQEAGFRGVEAAVRGTQRVAVPVVFGVLTTIAAFSPLLAVEGSIGKIMRVIPLIVIPALLFSLIESLFILPAHLSHFRGDPSRPSWPSRLWSGFQGIFSKGLVWTSEKLYAPALMAALHWRYLTVAALSATLILTGGLIGGGRIKFTFLPEVEADNAVAFVTMPLGTPVEKTMAAVRSLEQAAVELEKEFDEEVIVHRLSSVGEQPFRNARERNPGGSGAGGSSGSHLGEVNLELTSAEERAISSSAVANRWREKTGPIADAVELTFTAALFSVGEPINIQLASRNLAQLERASSELKQQLTNYSGVYDINDTYRSGKQEVQLDIQPAAQTLGLTLSNLARQVRQAFYGEEAQRILRGRDEIKVMVRYPEAGRQSIGDLENMWIRTPDGDGVAFSSVASAEFGRGFSVIQRVDRRRTISVTAKIDESQANADEILAAVTSDYLPGLISRYPGLGYRLEGTRREQEETIQGLSQGFLLALILIFTLLAIPLRSYLQPLLIMSAIPFGLVGAVWGHLLFGLDLSILSLFGLVALSGVVVNDSLVLVHFVNRRREDGLPLFEAIQGAGIARFRPIILTTLTTFGGLTPLLLEKSLQAQFLIPMAISLAFGVAFSTLVTLFLVPTGYSILEDFRSALRWYLGPNPGTELAEPLQ